jgi:EAL and modified HD-GYP domain-containing signal transduction protein
VEALIARQPIFDRNRQVYGYELLYRSDRAHNEFDGTESAFATKQVISNTVMSIGLENILGDKKAFVNFDQRLLSEGIYLNLPPQAAVIEILESVAPTADLIALCRAVREQGYMIALDDFVSTPQFEPLTELAQLIKVDIRSTSVPEQERLLHTYKPRGIQLLAEKVETYEEFERVLAAGYDYFQGYFFARPSMIHRKEVPAQKLTCLLLLSEVQKPEPDVKRLDDVIRGDVALTYKLLRYVNSALFGRDGHVQSIERALVILGTDNIRRWAGLATLPRLAVDKPGELATLAIVRARFCESLIKLAGISLADEAFLMGMFSLLDALVDRPLDEALRSVGVGPEITNALLGTASDESTLSRTYRLSRGYERGDWDQVETLTQAYGFEASAVRDAYLGATLWASQMLHVAGN